MGLREVMRKIFSKFSSKEKEFVFWWVFVYINLGPVLSNRGRAMLSVVFLYAYPSKAQPFL